MGLIDLYIFQPIAVESHGEFSSSTQSFLTTLGEGLTGTSDNLRETSYLLKRLSVITPRFSSVLIQERLFLPTNNQVSIHANF